MMPYSRSELFAAIRLNEIEVIQSALTNPARSVSRGMGFCLLRESIRFNRHEITDLLLDQGCSVNLPSFVGKSPLHLAVVKPKCYSLVRRLLKRGANVNHKNKKNRTPIQVAFDSLAENKVVRLLLKVHLEKSALNVTDDEGLSYLHIACATADLDIVRKLVREGDADINAQVNQQCNSRYAGSTPLHMAVEYGTRAVTEYLLDQGADVYAQDSKGSTPIHVALELLEIDTIELMFEFDYDRLNYFNNNGLSHFMAACACLDPDIAKNFLDYESDEGRFMYSNETVDSPENADYALKGYTPLHFAALTGSLKTTALLLDVGANCCAVTAGNVTAIDLADNNGHETVSKQIKKYCRKYNCYLEL